jgi:hypothetical protein
MRQLPPGPGRKGTERTLAEYKHDVGGRRWIRLQNGFCGNQRVTAIMSFAHQYEHPPVRRKATDFFHVAHDRTGDGATGALHCRPFP